MSKYLDTQKLKKELYLKEVFPCFIPLLGFPLSLLILHISGI